jgi:mannose-6-phosphate isomerase-like protein (cupin superfamily)
MRPHDTGNVKDDLREDDVVVQRSKMAKRSSYRKPIGAGSGRQEYNNTGIKYGHLEVVDIPALVAACRKKWFNQTLVQVNDSVVRLGIVKGRFHWHKHDREDEFFFVLQGRLLIDLRNRTIVLNPGQGVVVPKNVTHRPRAPKKTVMLMVETRGIKPEGERRTLGRESASSRT